MDLTESFAAHLTQPAGREALARLADGLVVAKAHTEAALLGRWLREGGGASTLVTEASSPWLGRRAWVGPTLPVGAAGGDLWLDTVEVMPMVLVPSEPSPFALPPGAIWNPLFVWLACRPVAAWQLAGWRRALGEDAAGPRSETASATGVAFAEAKRYAAWFGKVLSHHMAWQAAAQHLSPAVIEDLWRDLGAEWSGLRSEAARDRALVVPRDGCTDDPDEAIEAAGDDDAAARDRYARDPEARDGAVGLRTMVLVQLGLTAGGIERTSR